MLLDAALLSTGIDDIPATAPVGNPATGRASRTTHGSRPEAT